MNQVAEDNRPAAATSAAPWPNLNFGNPFSTTTVNPGRAARLGHPAVRLAVRRLGPAGSPAARVGRSAATTAAGGATTSSPTTARSTPADFDTATITAPANPNLPNGGGYPVTFVTRNARSPIGADDNYYTFASDYGDVTTYWHGVDFNVNARTRNGIIVPGRHQHRPRRSRLLRDHRTLPELFVTAGVGARNAQARRARSRSRG